MPNICDRLVREVSDFKQGFTLCQPLPSVSHAIDHRVNRCLLAFFVALALPIDHLAFADEAPVVVPAEAPVVVPAEAPAVVPAEAPSTPAVVAQVPASEAAPDV